MSLLCSRNAVTTVCLYSFFCVTLADDDPGIGVMSGTGVTMWTLTQRVGVHLVQQLLPFSHSEQATGLLPLTSQPLQWSYKYCQSNEKY